MWPHGVPFSSCHTKRSEPVVQETHTRVPHDAASSTFVAKRACVNVTRLIRPVSPPGTGRRPGTWHTGTLPAPPRRAGCHGLAHPIPLVRRIAGPDEEGTAAAIAGAGRGAVERGAIRLIPILTAAMGFLWWLMGAPIAFAAFTEPVA